MNIKTIYIVLTVTVLVWLGYYYINNRINNQNDLKKFMNSGNSEITSQITAKAVTYIRGSVDDENKLDCDARGGRYEACGSGQCSGICPLVCIPTCYPS